MSFRYCINLKPMICRNLSSKSIGLKEVFIINGSRTPIGSFKKSLNSLSAPQLGALTIKETLKRVNCKNLTVDEVLMGQVCQANSGQAPARQAALLSGLPTSVICTTINKVCASGMKSVMIGSQSIMCGFNNVVVAGGQESMSNVPFYITRAEPSYGGSKIIDGIVSDGLTDVYNQCHMGICAENTASSMKIDRAAQDAFAISSYEKSQSSAKNGIFAKEIVPVVVKTRKEEIVISADEEYTRVDFDKFKSLKPAFKKENGTVTAANASTLNDGAASMVIMSTEAMDMYKLKPMAKIVGFADAAVAPIDFPIAPAESIKKLLQLCAVRAEDVAMWEINEAFAVVVLANIELVAGIDRHKVNIHGGAVSMGHPIGMSGARLVLHLALNLRPGELGIASICNGGGGASSILIKGC